MLLGLTFLGACGFLGIKAMEYRPKIEHGLLWGKHFDPDPAYVAAHYGGEHHGETPAAHEANKFAPEEPTMRTVEVEQFCS